MTFWHRGNSLIIASFVVALGFTILPIPPFLAPFRPNLTMLVIIFWSLYVPERVGVLSAWAVGLLYDFMLGALLGQYALGFAIIAYLSYVLQARIHMFPIFQQSLAVGVLVGIAQVIAVWIDYFIGDRVTYLLQWMPIVTTAICWPLVALSLHALAIRFDVEI